jgi:hypothetical protein
MVFADFQLKTAVKAFDLSEDGKTDLFRDVEPIEPSEHLRGWLAEFAPVALGINTEQARRENIIAPILSESKRRSRVEINVLPGVMLTVDSARGLTGYCDYLIARSPEFFYVKSPVVAVVEAKREDLIAGLGQCAAEMVAIQLFNEKEGSPMPAVYGCVTSGSIWRFLKLQDRELFIDNREYYLQEVDKILGILAQITRDWVLAIACGSGRMGDPIPVSMIMRAAGDRCGRGSRRRRTGRDWR